MFRRLCTLVLTAALVLAAACSRGDSTDASPTTSVPSRPQPSADDSALGPGLVQQADLGGEWRASPVSSARAAEAGDLEALCGRSVPLPPKAGLTVGFVRGETGDAVTHSVRRYEPGQAIPAVGAIAAAGIACKEWPVGAQQRTVAIQPLNHPEVGERWVGFRIRTVDGDRPFAADVIAWQRGDYVSVLTMVSVKLLDADLTKRLLPVADEHLKRLAAG